MVGGSRPTRSRPRDSSRDARADEHFHAAICVAVEGGGERAARLARCVEATKTSSSSSSSPSDQSPPCPNPERGGLFVGIASARVCRAPREWHARALLFLVYPRVHAASRRSPTILQTPTKNIPPLVGFKGKKARVSHKHLLSLGAMAPLPNLATLTLGITPTGTNKKARNPKKKEAAAIDKSEEELMQAQIDNEEEKLMQWRVARMARNLERVSKVLVKCRDATLALTSVYQLETPEQVEAFLIMVVRNEYLAVFMSGAMFTAEPFNAMSRTLHMWKLHWDICEQMRQGNAASFGTWDPPKNPLIVEGVMNKKFKEVALLLFNHHIALDGPDGMERSQADIVKIVNDPMHASLMRQALQNTFSEVFLAEEDKFLVQTRAYWVNLEEREIAMNYALGRLVGKRPARHEQEGQVLIPSFTLPSYTLPSCPRPPRPVA